MLEAGQMLKQCPQCRPRKTLAGPSTVVRLLPYLADHRRSVVELLDHLRQATAAGQPLAGMQMLPASSIPPDFG